jgi:hypothetical protein
LYNESEHFSFALPFTVKYALRVRWFREIFDTVGDANQEFYGLAWSGVAGLSGDFNHDGTVNAADYVVWRKNPGGIYTQDDYNTWRDNFGQTLITGSGSGANATDAIPEPAMLVLLPLRAAVWCLRRGRNAYKSQQLIDAWD